MRTELLRSLGNAFGLEGVGRQPPVAFKLSTAENSLPMPFRLRLSPETDFSFSIK
ncbi:MAG: hypothetical protein IJV65_01490 [Kiritimatiellae bacterium]|nr:hypothetical protein [Kiritimatiellia bacterium]